MVLVDTNFIIDLMRGDSEAIEKAEELEGSSEKISVPTPVILELWEGIERSGSSTEEEEKVMRFLESFVEIPLKKKHAKIAGRKSGELVRNGVVLDPVDIMIGGMAISEGEVLVTSDGDLGRLPGVMVEDY